MLKDPNFDHAVILVCIHNADGAMGLIVNRAAPISLNELARHMGIEMVNKALPGRHDETLEIEPIRVPAVLVGGPVAANSGLLLYSVASETVVRDDEIDIGNDLRLCPNQQLLRQICAGNGPQTYRMFLGHAGWGPGQIEQEISQGVWLPAKATMSLIFEAPLEDRWEEALRTEGFSPQMLTSRSKNKPSA